MFRLARINATDGMPNRAGKACQFRLKAPQREPSGVRIMPAGIPAW
jgi:hypothetical protein